PTSGTLDRQTRAHRSPGERRFSIPRRPQHELSRERRQDADLSLWTSRRHLALHHFADPGHPHPGVAVAHPRASQTPRASIYGRQAGLTGASVRAHTTARELVHDPIEVERRRLLPWREGPQGLHHRFHVRLDRNQDERVVEEPVVISIRVLVGAFE